MPATEARRGGPATLGDLLNKGAADGPLELNTAEAATCRRCGQEPRLHHHVSPGGRDVTIWIPVEHRCKPQ